MNHERDSPKAVYETKLGLKSSLKSELAVKKLLNYLTSFHFIIAFMSMDGLPNENKNQERIEYEMETGGEHK